ncbi:YbjN domain-containing protein [Leisingera daeponensis]|uniref:YbjN domain-containing protein n=1 Tax=Leisingera daeponensis TaxID=405746 RepID=UPI001C94819D|nr:YbjN domain-containing protein [Leisingera daeponensis]MBY6057671.1 YbjN domain-containing protein [Leisingera daeponensis]
MYTLKAIAAAAVLVMPAAAMAENVVAKTGDSVANFFKDEGAEVEMTTDSVGDPNLKVEYYGNDFSVYYYGCDNNTDCEAIQFFSGYQTDGSVRLSKINEWNTNNRFARAYVSEEGSARIEMDLLLGDDGMTPDDFADAVGIWNRAVQDFEEFIGW